MGQATRKFGRFHNSYDEEKKSRNHKVLSIQVNNEAEMQYVKVNDRTLSPPSLRLLQPEAGFDDQYYRL